LYRSFGIELRVCKSNDGKSPRCASVDPQKILQRVAKKYGVDWQRLVAPGERGLQAKNVAMWIVWETGSKSLREIGELFGGLDYAAVPQRIHRTKSTYNLIAARRPIATC
jgi:chromosomal replication initiation ATPase DnaA